MSVLAKCGQCPWEQFKPTKEAADKQLRAHEQFRHALPVLDGVVQVDTVKWREQAMTAVGVLAAKGEPFTFFDLHDAGIADPPNARTAWGQFAKDVHALGIAHPIGYQQSTRPGTKASAVRVWHGDITRCSDCRQVAS